MFRKSMIIKLIKIAIKIPPYLNPLTPKPWDISPQALCYTLKLLMETKKSHHITDYT